MGYLVGPYGNTSNNLRSSSLCPSPFPLTYDVRLVSRNQNLNTTTTMACSASAILPLRPSTDSVHSYHLPKHSSLTSSHRHSSGFISLPCRRQSGATVVTSRPYHRSRVIKLNVLTAYSLCVTVSEASSCF